MRKAVPSLLLFLLLSLVPSAAATCHVREGSLQDTWSDPVSVGPAQTTWQPHDVLGPDAVAGLTSLTVRLEWTNGPDGGADLGIAVGTATGFQYWNQEFQTNVGDFEETLTLDVADLEAVGWSGDGLTIGPSISTGGFSVSGIDYTLSWSVETDVLCDEGVPSDGGPTASDGGPMAGDDAGADGNGWDPLRGLLWLGAAAVVVGAVVAAVVVVGRR